LRQESRLKREYEKRSHIEKYLPHVGIALQEILELNDEQRDQSVAALDEVLHRTRKLQ
jgi:DNA topoisomerase-6 subunit B